MMGDRRVDQGALFYRFSLDRHVPVEHVLRSIDRFVDLEGVGGRRSLGYGPGMADFHPSRTFRRSAFGEPA